MKARRRPTIYVTLERQGSWRSCYPNEPHRKASTHRASEPKVGIKILSHTLYYFQSFFKCPRRDRAVGTSWRKKTAPTGSQGCLITSPPCHKSCEGPSQAEAGGHSRLGCGLGFSIPGETTDKRRHAAGQGDWFSRRERVSTPTQIRDISLSLFRPKHLHYKVAGRMEPSDVTAPVTKRSNTLGGKGGEGIWRSRASTECSVRDPVRLLLWSTHERAEAAGMGGRLQQAHDQDVHIACAIGTSPTWSLGGGSLSLTRSNREARFLTRGNVFGREPLVREAHTLRDIQYWSIFGGRGWLPHVSRSPLLFQERRSKQRRRPEQIT
ncbi:hypothetical protein LZ31DRAFT_145582 [Colletotrichum somersetense]|nr:hypothetical protein LZ31DRAFT_145582 [Colletotrichum somersetense]